MLGAKDTLTVYIGKDVRQINRLGRMYSAVSSPRTTVWVRMHQGQPNGVILSFGGQPSATHPALSYVTWSDWSSR
jgi:hypothetical protein